LTKGGQPVPAPSVATGNSVNSLRVCEDIKKGFGVI
jgi:hypothetical protein